MRSKAREPIWVDRIVVDAVHADQLIAHGGLPGIKDENALESALARPRHRFAYGRQVDLARLAAGYGFGLARNHPYRDGNKRIAFLVMAVFLGLNGYELDVSEAEVVTTMIRLSAGAMSENALAAWLRRHLARAS